MGAPHTCLWGHQISIQPKLGLHGTSRLEGTLRIQFLRNPGKKPTPRNATSRDPRQMLGPQSLQSPASKCSAPSRAPSVSAPQPETGPQSPASSIGSAPDLTKSRLQVGRLRLLFRPRGVIQSSDWVVALGLPDRLTDSSPSPRAGGLARGSHALRLSHLFVVQFCLLHPGLLLFSC